MGEVWGMAGWIFSFALFLFGLGATVTTGMIPGEAWIAYFFYISGATSVLTSYVVWLRRDLDKPFSTIDRRVVVGVVAAAAAIGGAGGGSLWTFVRSGRVGEDDLRASFSMTSAPLQTVFDGNTVMRGVFRNRGPSTVIIDRIRLYEFYFHSGSDHQCCGEIDKCDYVLPEQSMFYDMQSEQVRSQTYKTYIDGLQVMEHIFNPTKIILHGSALAANEISLAPNDAAELLLEFSTDKIDKTLFDSVVLCPMVSVYNSENKLVQAVCRGAEIRATSQPAGSGTALGTMFALSNVSRILPESSKPSCPVQAP